MLFLYRIMCRMRVNNVLPKLGEPALLMALTPVIRPRWQFQVHHRLGYVTCINRLLEADHQFNLKPIPFQSFFSSSFLIHSHLPLTNYHAIFLLGAFQRDISLLYILQHATRISLEWRIKPATTWQTWCKASGLNHFLDLRPCHNWGRFS